MSDLTAAVDRRYPSARRWYRQFRNRRGRDGVPSWPDWCYVPLAGAVAVQAGDPADLVNRLAAAVLHLTTHLVDTPSLLEHR